MRKLAETFGEFYKGIPVHSDHGVAYDGLEATKAWRRMQRKIERLDKLGQLHLRV